MMPIAWCPLEINLGPLAPHNIFEVAIGLVTAGIIWFGFAKFISPGFEKMYQERSRQIEGGIELAERAQAEADALRNQYAAQLADANGEANAIRDQAKAQAAAIVEQARDQAGRESTRMLEQAKAQIETEREIVSSQLRGEVGTLATALASKIVGESLEDDDRARRAIDRFLAQLATQPAVKG
ncbi:MAG: F0F1 ATP synthase subunit B [Propionibacteriaceae bacterium]|jgi:F-type H+-transporting ATPase subunit b|nr:F0F1 ATP synthase subunit B [Propionibacteriaceae bacterium]